jgi:alpha/beta superfamily hydrolase
VHGVSKRQPHFRISTSPQVDAYARPDPGRKEYSAANLYPVLMLQTITDLCGPAGRLEALLNTGTPEAPFSALITHPHPLFGGTMHNKVVYHAMKGFAAFSVPVLRFNFRGTGLSEGTHDEARGEVDDVLAALDYLHALYGKPILFAGFSFGSYVGLRACGGDSRVAGLVGLGLPVSAAGRSYTYEFLPRCTQPKLFISGDHDEFSTPEALMRILATAPPPMQTVTITDADHFFQGIPTDPTAKLDQMQLHLRTWLSTTFKLPVIP